MVRDALPATTLILIHTDVNSTIICAVYPQDLRIQILCFTASIFIHLHLRRPRTDADAEVKLQVPRYPPT